MSLVLMLLSSEPAWTHNLRRVAYISVLVHLVCFGVGFAGFNGIVLVLSAEIQESWLPVSENVAIGQPNVNADVDML